MRPYQCFLCHANLRPGAAACPSCHLQLLVKNRFALYELAHRGGFGTVFKASDRRQANRICAVKVLPLETQEQTDRALHEVGLLRRHQLRFMPSFYTAEQYGSRMYIVTDYIDGATLDTFPRSYWRPDRVEHMVYVLLGYLSELHQRRITHRDMSPTNIMSVGGTPASYVLLDFGIAKEGTATISAAHLAANPSFASPEQIDFSGTSEASDLYSLGATAYKLLTGDVPTAEERLGGRPLARPSALVADVSPVLDELLVWMLQLDPGRRPPSAAAARAWVDSRYRPAPRRRTFRWGPWPAAAVVLLALLGVAWVFGSSGARGGQPAAEPDPGVVVFSGRRAGSFELYVADGAGAPPRPLAALPGDEFAPAWSPDGRQIAYVRSVGGNDDIYRVTLDGRVNEPVAASEKTEATPAWSPDGEWVAFSSNYADDDHELYIARPGGVGGWARLTFRRGLDWFPVWTADGQIIFISHRGSGWGLYRIDPASREETPVFTGGGPMLTLAISPDGGRLAFGMEDGAGNMDIYTLALGDTRPRRLTDDPADEAYPAWSPDGERLLFQREAGAGARQLHVVNADGTGEERVSQGADDDRQPAWRRGEP